MYALQDRNEDDEKEWVFRSFDGKKFYDSLKTLLNAIRNYTHDFYDDEYRLVTLEDVEVKEVLE